MTVVYDPTGTLAGNRFTNESHVVTEPFNRPTYFPFYLKDLEIKGTPAAGGADVVLELAVDFSYSPPFVTRQQETGAFVHSYIVLNDYEAWSHLKWTYRAVGQDSTHLEDVILMNEIAQRGSFDRFNVSIWASFFGELAAIPLNGFEFNLQNTQILQLFMQRMAAITIALQEPSRLISYFTTTISNLQSSVTNLLSLTNSWKAAFDAVDFFTNPLLTSETLSELIAEQSVLRITQNTVVYVDSAATGTDTGENWTNAFPNIQAAINYVSPFIGPSFDVDIMLADGTYEATEGSSIKITNVNNTNLRLIGNTANPENVVITSTLLVDNSNFSYGGVKLIPTVGNCIFIRKGSTVVQLEGVEYGECASTHIHITGSSVFSQVNVTNYKISGDAVNHIIFSHHSEWAANNVDVTLVGVPHFSTAFLFGNSFSMGGYVNGYRVTGTATGKKFNIDTAAHISGTGGNVNVFPGDDAGTVVSAHFALYL
jgi:hypothetical protein